MGNKGFYGIDNRPDRHIDGRRLDDNRHTLYGMSSEGLVPRDWTAIDWAEKTGEVTDETSFPAFSEVYHDGESGKSLGQLVIAEDALIADFMADIHATRLAQSTQTSVSNPGSST